MTNNKVTVLISTFNRSAFLVESIESILAQTWPVDKFIVINDGSTDDTLDVLKAYEVSARRTGVDFRRRRRGASGRP